MYITSFLSYIFPSLLCIYKKPDNTIVLISQSYQISQRILAFFNFPLVTYIIISFYHIICKYTFFIFMNFSNIFLKSFFVKSSIPTIQIPSIHLLLHIIQTAVIPVRNNSLTQLFKLLQIIHSPLYYQRTYFHPPVSAHK